MIVHMELPTFTEGEVDTESILQYLAKLRNDLQYSVNHLDADNFTDAGLSELVDELLKRLKGGGSL